MTSITIQAETQSLLDSIGSAWDLWQWYQQHGADFAEMKLLIEKFRAIDNPTSDEGMKQAIRLLLPAAKLATRLTPTPRDDAALAYVEPLMANDALLDLMASLLSKVFERASHGINTMQACSTDSGDVDYSAYKADFEAASIPWGTVIQFLLPIALEQLKKWMANNVSQQSLSTDDRTICGKCGAQKKYWK